jgi:hypothetical protein
MPPPLLPLQRPPFSPLLPPLPSHKRPATVDINIAASEIAVVNNHISTFICSFGLSHHHNRFLASQHLLANFTHSRVINEQEKSYFTIPTLIPTNVIPYFTILPLF